MLNWTIPDFGAGILILIIWEVFWKAIGLWKSAKRGDLIWFIAILLINLFGILPLFYLWRTKQLEGVLKDFQNFFKSRFQKK
ncbi:hypothetical protein A2867_04805 [Candidatus Daviesbacteria bacterium RIFCSPHIGHO2_01_FULL_40_11]|uniref:DUF5652 domain-containing protein n=1 Tax=Candidatus Daviesbacteria bacterium RIFCSPHIGHO2_01_FULL_40_11 TaxID=1797762 RepID=A0A1F5JI18_9BACT|nr:MAG: hypothetical protein A2867_04805 [Candidatus Daviesbacteria bacterium RIFCSPHIGHO2_01_FULL_40_11]OGE62935.1 MAG: hypothetical protein A2964_00300 [Candidatus Daviesbacteria bacterium RIFCSPLOWO2_01_FULL_40_27]